MLLGLATKLLGGGLIGKVADVALGWARSPADKADHTYKEHMAFMAAYHREFSDRTPFDRTVNGINRLVRPLFTVSVLAFFTYCMWMPAKFAVAMGSLALVPDYAWGILGAVVAFWFGGRFLGKDRKTEVNPHAVASALKAHTEYEDAQEQREVRKAERDNAANQEAIRRKLRRENNG